MSDHDWKSVVSWWSPTDVQALDSRELLVPVPTFTARIEWLRHNWKVRGGSWDISPAAKEAVRGIRSTGNDFEALLSREPHDSPLAEGPQSLTKELEPDQISNLAHLLGMKNGANFSVPGAGKTLTTMALWQTLKTSGHVGSLLVIGPRSAFDAWTEEATHSFDPIIKSAVYRGEPIDLGVELVITNYEQLENTSKQSYLAAWVGANKAMVVLDEAHRIKSGPKSRRWQGCRAVVSRAARVDLLTGTPMPQGPSDLVGMFSLSWPGLPPDFFTPGRLVRMKRNTAFVRTTKTELALPPTEITAKSQSADPIQSEIYDALVEKYAGAFSLSIGGEKLLAQRGKAVMTLIAAASNPALLNSKESFDAGFDIRWPPSEVKRDDSLMLLVSNYLEKEMPWKFRWVAGEAKRLAEEGKKLLIWTSFVGNIKALGRILEPFQPAIVYGQTDLDSRALEISRFRDSSSCHVLITNPQTLGEGISLHHDCNNAVYIDRTFNAGQYLQSIDRIHRRGLDPDVLTQITILKTLRTVDERVDERLAEKVAKLGAFLDDPNLAITALPGDETDLTWADWLGADPQDLAAVFEHLSDPGTHG